MYKIYTLNMCDKTNNVVNCVIRNYINSIMKRIYVSEKEKMKCITDSYLMKYSKLIALWHKAVYIIPSRNTEQLYVLINLYM